MSGLQTLIYPFSWQLHLVASDQNTLEQKRTCNNNKQIKDTYYTLFFSMNTTTFLQNKDMH
jgi:hypothetical protein